MGGTPLGPTGGRVAASSLHNRIAAVALAASGRYGFALGGGCALVAHGLVDRPTEDVDLFTDVAAALPRYGRDRLLELAAEHDPGLGPEDFAAAVRRLDGLPDEPF
ncbi:MAG TPA: nucleotidyl transferase AbiEii/AbiGii toxin family protein, partial [Micromonosporaceae bacterium]|nr:nucleotidyl transferase AbiEii/AbiGii toxin family protein [Micromonosporaceae bacterium]